MRKLRYRSALCALVLLAATTSLLFDSPVHAEDCNGTSLDGQPMNANAYSFRTGNWYQIQVVFQDDFALLQFDDGSNLVIHLSSESVSDPRAVVGLEQTPDPDLGVPTSWQLDLGQC